MNIRNAAVLGYVGAGGIGIILNERLGWRMYPDVGLILLVMMVTVYLIETLSRTLRKNLL
jgi:phosphonate transport system permease protein